MNRFTFMCKFLTLAVELDKTNDMLAVIMISDEIVRLTKEFEDDLIKEKTENDALKINRQAGHIEVLEEELKDSTEETELAMKLLKKCMYEGFYQDEMAQVKKMLKKWT